MDPDDCCDSEGSRDDLVPFLCFDKGDLDIDLDSFLHLDNLDGVLFLDLGDLESDLFLELESALHFDLGDLVLDLDLEEYDLDLRCLLDCPIDASLEADAVDSSEE